MERGKICTYPPNYPQQPCDNVAMRRIANFWRSGTIAPITLVASALIGLMALLGITLLQEAPVADMRIEPLERAITVNDRFEIEVVVESSVPVNVFAGELHFSKDLLVVDSISYNTSIADLWAELPWFSNGDGTLNFAGGSTRNGGFIGKGSLIKVTFKTLGEGDGIISVHNPRILLHDGLGTDAEVTRPIDAIFTIENTDANLLVQPPSESTYKVRRELPSTDLNGDGKQTIADISIFMLKIAKNDSRFDFNIDGKVDLKDLNILLGAR